jgi:transposase-like protein
MLPRFHVHQIQVLMNGERNGQERGGAESASPDEFKQEAVKLADLIGGNAAAKRLGIPQSTVTNWCAAAKLER